MSNRNSQPFLPPDILLSIIDALVPPSNHVPVAFPPWHPTTRTLLSLTRTSRITYPTAVRLLHIHCLYINSSHRLRGLIDSFIRLSVSIAGPPAIQPRTLSLVSVLGRITSLYLSPFPIDSIDDLPTSHWVHELLSGVAPTLRRLVIDIPLRSIYPWQDHLQVRPMLRRAFTPLTALEVFCSVQDELYLTCSEPPLEAGEPPVWSMWPRLRTLALYNPDVSAPDFWPSLGKLPNLETLVLTRSDGLQQVDVKEEWKKHCGDRDRKLSVVLVNIESDHTAPMGSEAWNQEDSVAVRAVNVPTSYYGDEDRIELCQEWIKRRMLGAEEIGAWT